MCTQVFPDRLTLSLSLSLAFSLLPSKSMPDAMSAAQKTHMLQSGSVSDRQAMEAPRSHPVANTAPEDSNGFPWHLVRKCFTDSRRPMSHSCQFLPWAKSRFQWRPGRGGGLQKDPSTNVTVVTRAITPWRFRGREVDPDHVLTNRHCHSELRSPSTNQQTGQAKAWQDRPNEAGRKLQ